ncbi:MAG TPA: putative DNA modification/repair radical SAM protein [Candidatus Cottocaccamicrobium excrementipullorum]|nr:putative DNA modification/repair radical SAM protein [Candidatus Cottocaccamicrobium excrementipullorum]
MLIQENLSIQEKLSILSDAAKYDVSCTSSGVERKGKKGGLGCASQEGICHSFTSDGRCVSLLKILLTNQCIYDCKYCINRCSNDTLRTAFTPEEVCSLTMEFYRRNYIEGLFLSSGILGSPDHTMELICQILWKLRRHHQFNGYIHVKAIPGADPSLIEAAGFLADRMSVNLELPTAEGLRRLAPGKTREKILKPMRQIQTGILRQIQAEGLALPWSLPEGEQGRYLSGEKESGRAWLFSSEGKHNSPVQRLGRSRYGNWGIRQDSGKKAYFVPGGQSTQMIVGATPETDFQMLSVAEALYQKFGMKRVFYSAYVPVNQDAGLPALPGGPPLLREHRLYQADWLMRYYGFDAGELLTEKRPNFNLFLDPKCDWALQHLEKFPVEVNSADYQTLLRVPGMGIKSVSRILSARKTASLSFSDLKKIGVVLKRAQYFITCSGRMMNSVKIDQDYIASCLLGEERRRAWEISASGSYRQLSLFDDMHLQKR